MTALNDSKNERLDHQEPRSVYVHIPFCLQRCGYCDFSIIAGRDNLIPRFLRALEREIERTVQAETASPVLDTLFIGGGTPTLLSASQLEQLFSILYRHFQFSKQAEVSIEANPDGFTIDKQNVLRDNQVNRISLGVQSFDPQILKQLDRTHSPEDVKTLHEQLQSRFENISFDLIYAVPGQSFSDWKQTLNQAILLDPAHLSTYSLTFEKGTTFWTQRHQGKLQQTEEDLELQMYLWTIEQLKSNGFDHYEISNFAKFEMESRHNSAYWTGKSYWAFGPGAASFTGGVRRINHRSPFTWLKRIESGLESCAETDDLTNNERARELFSIGLRYLQGVELSYIERQTGYCIEEILETELELLTEKGWIEQTNTHIKLTKQGIIFADEIACRVV